MQHISEERERFEALFRTHRSAVRAYVRNRRRGGDVDDIVADVFLVVWRRLDDVPSEPLPWLLGIARNTVLAAQRREARRLRLTERVEAEPVPPTPGPEVSDDGPDVLSALARLNETDREALTLVAWEGLTPAQAAESLRIPANRFRVRLHRASRRLRWALQAELDEAADHSPRSSASAHISRGAIA